MIGTPKIYTTTGFGPRKNREMAGVDDLVVYMQTAVKYNTFYIHHPGGAKRPRGGVLEIWGCELVKAPRNREMLCKRCECVSECECNVIRDGVALVVRSFQNSFFCFFSAWGPSSVKRKGASVKRKGRWCFR